MSPKRLMIVEDEALIAMDLRSMLEDLGYSVTAEAASADEAFERAGETPLDLVLMDIRLQDGSDGVDAAERLRQSYNLPVVFVTSHMDEETVHRATRSEPFGYIAKPYRAPELRACIEVALYKHAAEKRYQERADWFASTIRGIQDGVIATDALGHVVFMNAAAERLTGWIQENTVHTPIEQVFSMTDNPMRAVLNDLPNVAASLRLMARKSGERILIEENSSPLRDREGRLTGAVVAFRDVTQRLDMHGKRHPWNKAVKGQS